MRRAGWFGAAAAIAAGTIVGCATRPGDGAVPGEPPPPAVVDLRGYRIDARLGQRFEVHLPGNPSTGYRWTLIDPVPAQTRQVGVVRIERVGGGGSPIGAPVQEVFTFEAAQLGVATLAFEYRRPWEPGSVPPAQRTRYRLEVR